jgi:hypothetical protein
MSTSPRTTYFTLTEQMDEANAIRSLEPKSVDWVEEWLSRVHSGTTGFSEL